MRNILFLLCCFHTLNLFSQNIPKPYFQQEVNYDIQVTLNDVEHRLEGVIEIEYVNNAKESLDFIYMHLWPNAYKHTETAFAKQQVENGYTDFFYSNPSERGFIEGLAFTVNDEEVNYKSEVADYGKLILNEPLESGEMIIIKTPFEVKIPDSFSRLGHVGQSYQITQWYPKPAVYDNEGWHPMSYLDQGEFYSEFGCFDVKITLPKNYIVGATGDLQNEEEIAFLNKKAEETKAITNFEHDDKPEFPESSSAFKTLEYKQCNIHDFAWFADKRFHVLKGEATMPESGRKVDLWTMFTDTESDLWQNSIEYLHDGVVFYSEKVGEYPFNQCTAVQSALSAGAGMEYPQVTVIGKSYDADGLEDVIVHEVGHNWFYGQLGFNERKYPYLDEGINTYYDQRYKREKYPDKKFEIPSPFKTLVNPKELPARDVWELAYQIMARQGKDQAVGLPSEEFTEINYGAMVYSKTGLMFDYLAAYLGQDKFDTYMKKIYQYWEFKHPQPKDIENMFNQLSLKNLDWFFDDLVQTNKKVDYQLYKVNKNAETIGEDVFHKVKVLNHPNNVPGPFTLTAIKDGEAQHTIWYDGFTGNEEVLFPAMEYDKMVLDYYHRIPEYNRKNNTLKSKGLLKSVEAPKFRLIGNMEDPYRTQIFLSPAIAYNVYDGFQLGLSTYNNIIPSGKFEYALAAMYGFKSKLLTGVGEIAYNLRPSQGLFSNIKPALKFSTFGDGNYRTRVRSVFNDDTSEIVDYENGDMRYFRLAPEVKFELRNSSLRSKVKQSITVRHISLFKNENATTNIDNLSGVPVEAVENTIINSYNTYDTPRANYFNQIIYDFSNRRAVLPFGFGAMVEQNSDFLKASLQANIKINYPKNKKGVSFRVFAGAFLWENDIFKDLAVYSENDFYQFGLNNVGRVDYTYSDLWVGRHELDGFWSQQVNPTGFNAGFRTVNAFNNGIAADKWIASLNIELESPLKIPLLNMLSAYCNIAANNRSIKGQSIKNSQMSLDVETGAYESKLMYELGLGIKIIPDAFEVYFPLTSSKDLKDNSVVEQKFSKQITFLLNLNRLNLVRQLRNIDL